MTAGLPDEWSASAQQQRCSPLSALCLPSLSTPPPVLRRCSASSHPASLPLCLPLLSQWETRSLAPVMARQLLSAAKDDDGRLSVNNTALQQVRGRAGQAARILPLCCAPLC